MNDSETKRRAILAPSLDRESRIFPVGTAQIGRYDSIATSRLTVRDTGVTSSESAPRRWARRAEIRTHVIRRDHVAGALRRLALALLVMLITAPWSEAADLDRTAVDFTPPADIKWVRNAAGTNEQAVLYGDPSKPGPYVVRIKWLPGNMS